MQERWLTVPSEPLLEVSSLGRVRSVPYETAMPYGGFKINQMAPTIGVTVYPSPNYRRKQVTFKRRTYKVHSLIAEAFIGKRPVGLDVSHKDGDATNNAPDNLLYETRKDNIRRRFN
jgi:hypothetical protein